MNVEIMTAEELVQYAKPTTTLEKRLIEKLRETLEDLEKARSEQDHQE